MSDRPIIFTPRVVVVALIAGGLAASLSEFFFWSQRRQEERRIDAAFAATAAGWQEAIQREANLFVEVLDSLRHLQSLTTPSNADRFAEFEARGLAFARSELGGFGFARRLPSSEAGAAQFPVTHTEPEGLLPPGFDLGSDAARRRCMEAAAADGATRVGAPLLTPDPLVISPILSLRFDAAANAYMSEWTGVVFAWMRPGKLLQRALPRQAAPYLRAELAPPATRELQRDSGEPWFEGPIRIADQQWTFRAQAQPGYREEQRSGAPPLLRLSGVALALLAAWLGGFVSSNHARVRRLVGQRTAELEREREERLRLEQELLEAGRRERQRVGQDLHDSLGQKLSGAVLLARAASQRPPAEAQEECAKVATLLKDAVAQVRRIARGLAPVDLDNASLAAALQRLADEVCDLQGVACAAAAGPEVFPRDAAAATHLYQIAQEAVNNAIRHGGAREIQITLGQQAGWGVLEIRDFGKGLSLEAAADGGGGLGLRLMRHRATLIGGDIELIPGPANACLTVRCRFPLAANSDRNHPGDVGRSAND